RHQPHNWLWRYRAAAGARAHASPSVTLVFLHRAVARSPVVVSRRRAGRVGAPAERETDLRRAKAKGATGLEQIPVDFTQSLHAGSSSMRRQRWGVEGTSRSYDTIAERSAQRPCADWP